MRAYTSGSWSRTHSSFGAVNPGSTRLPVNSISRSAPTVSVMVGAFGWPSVDRSTESQDGARRRWHRAGRDRASAPSARRSLHRSERPRLYRVRHGCSRTSPATKPPGPARPRRRAGYGADTSRVAVATTRPVSSTRTALQPDVPTSMPRSTVISSRASRRRCGATRAPPRWEGAGRGGVHGRG